MEVKNGSGDSRDIVYMPKGKCVRFYKLYLLHFCYILEFKLKIMPSEVLIFNKDNSNGYNELMASLTFVNDYKDAIAFKVTKSLNILIAQFLTNNFIFR